MVSWESKISSWGSWPVRCFQNSHEVEDLVVLLVLAQVGVGVAEDAGLGVLGQEGQDPLLPAAALGNVVFLHQGVFPVEGDGVEVQVEGGAARQPQPAHGVEPARISFG